MNLFKKIILVGILIGFGLVNIACQKEVVKKPPVAVKQVEKEVPVIENLKDEEAKQLISDVRDYAEAFDIGDLDKAVRKRIKDGVKPGTDSTNVQEVAQKLIEPYLIKTLKMRIEESLKDKVGKATEADIEEVLSYVDVSGLMEFIVAYEIERLKMEGYLR